MDVLIISRLVVNLTGEVGFRILVAMCFSISFMVDCTFRNVACIRLLLYTIFIT